MNSLGYRLSEARKNSGFTQGQEYPKTRAGDVAHVRTVEYHIAVRPFENWCQATLCLTARHVGEIAAEGYDESAILFVNRDVHL